MRHLLSILLTIAALDIHAQVLDTAQLVVWYDVTYKTRVEEKELQNDKEVLEIGKDISYYYSFQRKQFNDIMDSIQRENPTEDPTSIYINHKIPGRGNSYHIYKNFPKGTLSYSQTVANIYFKYEEPLAEQNWNLAEGDSVILSMHCNKATIDFHGRHWVVWYTNEIPISDGPWKLCGLPGLIMKAYEPDGIFSFTCCGINKTSKPIFERKVKYVNTTRKNLLSEIKEYWDNQLKYIITKNNAPVPPRAWSNQEAFTPCLMEYH